MRQLARSMQEFGWTVPILVDEEGTIIAGHGRIMAAEQLGYRQVPVMVARGWSDAQKRAYVIADNQLALNAGWDEPLLRLELGELKKLDFDLSLTGFDDVRLATFIGGNAGNGEPEVAPEPEAVPITREGDLWLLGKHRLLCGDATNADHVKRVLAGAKPLLMVSDPPYGVEYDPMWRDDAGLKAWANLRQTGVVRDDHKMDWTPAWKLFPGDVAYVWHAGRFAADVQMHLAAADFETRSQIIWMKHHFAISRGDYHWQHEPCWYAVRKGKTSHWNGARDQSTAWDILGFQVAGGHGRKASNGHGGADAIDGKTGHGTQKPIECMKRPIINNSNPGEAIYDPFVGSGTTIIACELTGRVALALELEPAYVDVCVRRWEKFTGQRATLEGTKRTFEHVAKERAPEAA